ncbi:hypothetical protein L218DRAFT_949110 [Marasmius fiardii PR-910]|nr:hypothetical protein L218DRAFT_949110 [Marasmius fiardii PR-910]
MSGYRNGYFGVEFEGGNEWGKWIGELVGTCELVGRSNQSGSQDKPEKADRRTEVQEPGLNGFEEETTGCAAGEPHGSSENFVQNRFSILANLPLRWLNQKVGHEPARSESSRLQQVELAARAASPYGGMMPIETSALGTLGDHPSIMVLHELCLAPPSAAST